MAVVDGATISRLHAQFLDDPSPTDVLSFVLTRRGGWLEGEIVACAEVAVQVARRLRRLAADELLLYIVHGMLHLVGYDDRTPAEARRMRQQERAYLGPARSGGDRR